MGKKLNIENPETLNEKIQWMKLFFRCPEYSKLVDKITAKKYVASTIGEKYVIPTLGIWNKFDDIDFNELPDKFVLKCNHDSGSCVICEDKRKLNISNIRKFFSNRLNHNYYWAAREWFYKEIKPKIIAELYMEDEKTKELRDYKFYCFNGKVNCVLICLARKSGKPQFYFFDRKWNLKRYNLAGKNASNNFTIQKPDNIDEMFALAEKLADKIKIPFVRIDLYNVNSNIYFSEFTFYPDSGMDRHRLPEIDKYFGSLFDVKK